ncbi:hypothetical protein LCGC14_2511720 [marine sediment metagenome]|uniref:Uncharacterized protein n=1 Tax=marine sediment metagenome TaxID=412755 RepID=A0A0F9AZM1_9ZZZZ
MLDELLQFETIPFNPNVPYVVLSRADAEFFDAELEITWTDGVGYYEGLTIYVTEYLDESWIENA